MVRLLKDPTKREGIISASLIGIMFLFAGCELVKKYPQDNIIEEIAEEIIEQKTGLDIDLTPFSKEKQDE